MIEVVEHHDDGHSRGLDSGLTPAAADPAGARRPGRWWARPGGGSRSAGRGRAPSRRAGARPPKACRWDGGRSPSRRVIRMASSIASSSWRRSIPSVPTWGNRPCSTNSSTVSSAGTSCTCGRIAIWRATSRVGSRFMSRPLRYTAPAKGCDQARQGLEGGALPRSVGTHQSRPAPPLDAEAEALGHHMPSVSRGDPLGQEGGNPDHRLLPGHRMRSRMR